MRMSQAQKYHLSLAGEFYVAAELHRRSIQAAVTYGNAKRADVVAFSTSREKSVVIEVKSTLQARWVVGDRVPAPSRTPWVFVRMPADPDAPATYYVVLQSDLHRILALDEAAYRRKYRERHGGQEFRGRPVWNFTSKQAEPFKNAWEHIRGQLA